MLLSDLSWPMVDALNREIPVVIPVAALEQHGHHLPLFTDSLLLGEVMRRVGERLQKEVLIAPLLWLGNSDHHLDFTGTLSAAPRNYLDTLSALTSNFIMHGFKRIVFLNGHGGNEVPGKQALFEMRQIHRARKDLLLLFATYWSLGSEPNSKDATFSQRQMGHACEWETSMILRIRPELVAADHTRISPVEFGRPFDPAFRAWITKDRTVPGHIGSPHLASAEKGEKLFSIFNEDAVNLLRRVIAWDGKSWDG